LERLKNNFWLFQANPKVYDIRGKLEPGEIYPWVVSRYQTRINQDDIVFFWHSLEQAIYGTGRIESPPEWHKEGNSGKGGYRVNVLTESINEVSIGYERIREVDTLKRLPVLEDRKGTNFPVTPEEALALSRMTSIPIPDTLAKAAPGDYGFHLFTDKNSLTRMHVSHIVEMLVNITRPTPENIIHTISLILSAQFMASSYTLDSTAKMTEWIELDDTRNEQFIRWIQDILKQIPEKKKLLIPVPDREWNLESDLWDESVNPEDLKGLEAGNETYVSPTLAEVYESALEITGKVSGPVETDLRHICGAFLSYESGSTNRFLEKIGLSQDKLRSGFLEMVESVFPDDDAQAWRQALAPPVPDFVLLGYAADEDKGEDALGIDGEVDAFASVIASRVMQPPLSIGLFGNWGEGNYIFPQCAQIGQC
jgi:hypothetical protein